MAFVVRPTLLGCFGRFSRMKQKSKHQRLSDDNIGWISHLRVGSNASRVSRQRFL
jgi:hypothetical protein